MAQTISAQIRLIGVSAEEADTIAGALTEAVEGSRVSVSLNSAQTGRRGSEALAYGTVTVSMDGPTRGKGAKAK
jgi:hypothetical protein